MAPFTPRACKQLFEDLNTPSIHIASLNDKFINLKTGTNINSGEKLFKQFDSKFQKKQRNTNNPLVKSS